MLWITSPGFSTSVCGIIGLCSGSVYSWISRSCWIVRSGSERKVHWAPTDARNSWSVWWSSVEIVTIWVVGLLYPVVSLRRRASGRSRCRRVAPAMAVLGNAQSAFRESAGTVLAGRLAAGDDHVVVEHDGSYSPPARASYAQRTRCDRCGKGTPAAYRRLADAFLSAIATLAYGFQSFLGIKATGEPLPAEGSPPTNEEAHCTLGRTEGRVDTRAACRVVAFSRIPLAVAPPPRARS